MTRLQEVAIPIMFEAIRIAIVGSGAVGGYYGARLADAGLDVTFLLRRDYESVSQDGMRVKSIAGDITLPSVQCAQTSEEIGPVDLVVVAWKTTSNSHYEQVIRPLLHEGSLILTLQNGLGNVEQLARLFGSWRVFGGLCFVCINRTGPGEFCHSASGAVRVGEYQNESAEVSFRLAALVDVFKKAKIDAYAVANLQKAQWMKLVWNVPFNGLTIAEGGIDTGQLLAMPGMEQRVRNMMHEVQAVAAALGHEIKDDYIEHQIEVTKPMKNYRPSSMIDFVEGRDVEVDAIWREPLRCAHDLNVKVPEIEKLLGEIERRIQQRDK